jgi:hypothetical protein
MRLLLARLGVGSVEPVKRGEGVAYLGGMREGRDGRRKVLVAVRPGEEPIGRRSVGELRAGLKARGFDEGLLLAAGAANAEALAELRGSPEEIESYDGETLAQLCVRHGVGAVRRSVPVDTLDLDLLGEIAES